MGAARAQLADRGQAIRTSSFDCGGTRLLPGLSERVQERRKNTLVYFRVTDIEPANPT